MGRWRWGGGSPAGTRVGPSIRGLAFLAHKFPRGNTRPARPTPRALLLVAAAGAAWAVLAAGCGAGEGVDQGATVAVYVSGPLSGPEGTAGRAQCGGARRELARHGPRAGQVQVRVVCIGSAADGGKWTLAGVGANARRATEDSTTVGYIGETSPPATKFSSTILEAAGIAQVSGISGASAMARILSAIEAAGDAGNLREVVDEEISGGA